MLDEKKKNKIVRTIKKELRLLPDYDLDLNDLNQRISKYNDILPDVFWNIYGEPNFSNREMRKLDLSCISFENENMTEWDFSYTNINMDPTKVKDKCIDYLTLEGVDLSGYTLDGVSILESNLTDCNLMVDLDLVRRFSSRTKLEGCFVLESSVYGKDIPSRVLEGAVIVSSFENGRSKVLKK